MKLNKNFVQITVTALVSSAASFLFITTVKPDLSGLPLGPSEIITWEETDRYMDEYLDFKPLYVRYENPPGVEQIWPLKGFVFDTAHLNEIINRNHSGSNPDKVIFFFGQNGTFYQGSGLFDHKRGNIQLIAAGVRNGTLLKDAINGQQPSIYDRADPCPPMCPN